MAKTREQCLAEYHARAKDRRALAIAVLDGRIGASYFPNRWEWYDVKGEADRLRKQRKEEQRIAAAERARKAAKYAAQADMFG